MNYFFKLICSWGCRFILAGSVVGGMHIPSVMAQNAPTDYFSVVGPSAQWRGFKDLNKPDLLPVGSVPNTLQISYTAGRYAPDKLKFFLPPGTVMFTANFLVFLSQMESKGVMRLNTPPTTAASKVTRDMAWSPGNAGGGNFGGAFDETILRNILDEKEVFFYGNAGAGLMPVSYGGALINPIPTKGGYAYGRFQYPDGVLGATQWSVFVNKECYEKWYKTATWDANGNPSETAIHSCDPTPVLKLTPPSPNATDLELGELSIENATDIGTCKASSSLVAITPIQGSTSTSSVSVTVAADVVVPPNTSVTITCTSGNRVLTSEPITLKPTSPSLSIDKSSLAPGQSAVLSIKNATSIGTCTASSSLVAITPISISSVKVTIPSTASEAKDTPVVITCGALMQSVTVTKSAGVTPLAPELTLAAGAVLTELRLVSRIEKPKLADSNDTYFSCSSKSDYVQFVPDSTVKLIPPGKLTLKEVSSIPSTLTLEELSCNDRNRGATNGTYNTWKADFYLSQGSDGKISLDASEPQNITLKPETTADGFVKLNVVVPKRTTDRGALNVWFGAKVPVASTSTQAQQDLWFWLLKKNAAGSANEWKDGVPDTKPGTGLNITPVQGKDNEFSFVLPIFKQAELAAYQVGGRKIEGTVYYRFGSGELRKLSAVWKP